MDWQASKATVAQRGEYLLSSGKWADCHFLLGQDSCPQKLSAHKLILASASPVFEAMFYGELAEKDEPIHILDIRAEAFQALLVYIYTDKIEVASVDRACELCYAAKKYMLWHVVETCTNFIFKDLRPANVCRALEFARLFEEPRLTKNCMHIICTRTMEVLEDASFEEADVNTVLTIVEQNVLNINSELSLFHAISRYADRQQLTADVVAACAGDNKEQEQQSKERQAQWNVLRQALKRIRFLTLTPQEFAEGPGKSKLLTQTEAFHILMNISSQSPDTLPMPEGFTATREHRTIGSFEFRATQPLNQGPHDIFELFDIPASSSSSSSSVIVPPPSCQSQQAVQQLPPPHLLHNASVQEAAATPPPPPHPLNNNNNQEAADGEEENQSHQQLAVVPLAEGNHGSSSGSNLVSRRFYCHRFVRTQTDCLNTSILDCALTFSVDRSICITGCQVPTQVLGGMNIPQDFPERYSELLYAHLLDALGSRLTYTHCTTRVHFDAMLEIAFDRPVFVQKDKVYKIGVVFNKVGWYPMALCVPSLTCNGVTFSFGVGAHNESVRDGLIRAIVFKFPNDP